MNPVPKHADVNFTASSYILNETRDKILLIDHSKSNLWLQPGGYVEAGEIPSQTAKREVREETGYTIQLLGKQKDIEHDKNNNVRSFEPISPFKINVHKLYDGQWHYDIAFISKAIGRDAQHSSDEHTGIRWFTKKQITELERIPLDVKQAAIEALEQNIH